MRVIIAAAGGQGKWQNHLGVPSHLAPVDGEPLLARTIRQLSVYQLDVHLTTPDDDRYDLAGVTRHVLAAGGNEYTSTRGLWSGRERTVLMLGDVYWTDIAMRSVIRHPSLSYRAFGRYGASRHTGCPYGEIFAASWGPTEHAKLDRLLVEVDRLRESGECTRPPGWVLLRLWQGTPVDRHLVRRPWWQEINDWTDDFDYAVDYDRHPAIRKMRAGVRVRPSPLAP